MGRVLTDGQRDDLFVEWDGGIPVVPGTAALVDTQFAPTVLTPRVVVPGTAALVDTQLAPAAVIGTNVVPAAAALTLTPFVPTITVGSRSGHRSCGGHYEDIRGDSDRWGQAGERQSDGARE